MSNWNVLSEHPLKFATATVGVFSHDMKNTLLVCNDKIGALVPPWGKSEKTDVNIYHTGLRELWEEVGIDMPVTPGDWLDENGEIAQYQTVVNIQPFHIGTQEMLDHLFLYRLDKQYSWAVFAGEKQWRWYAKRDIEPETITIQDTTYRVLVPGTRETILALLR